MKCELCHNAEAEVAIHRTIDGEDRELYVCKKCAALSDQEHEKEQMEKSAEGEIQLKNLGGKAIPVPPEFITELLKKMLDSGIETAEILENPTATKLLSPCPVCGFTPTDFSRLSRLGCPACYQHFAEQLAPLIHDMHRGGRRHIGKRPENKKTDR